MSMIKSLLELRKSLGASPESNHNCVYLSSLHTFDLFAIGTL
jgi:hypothetical protein